MTRARAFTLVEVMIVVLLLGILATITVRTIAQSNKSACGSTLKFDLQLLRRFIIVYAAHHNEVAPGYPDGDRTAAPTEEAFIAQARLSSNEKGQTAPRRTPGFKFGPYLSKIPTNPFNKLDTVAILADGAAFPAAASDKYGWICKPQSGEIRPDNVGTEDGGERYYDY